MQYTSHTRNAHTFHIDLCARQKHGKFGMTIEPVCQPTDVECREQTHTPTQNSGFRSASQQARALVCGLAQRGAAEMRKFIP